MKHSHYFKSVEGLTHIDVYRVLRLYAVTDPSLQHIAKKSLCAGLRGHKDFRRDLEDIRDTAVRALEMLDEDDARQLASDGQGLAIGAPINFQLNQQLAAVARGAVGQSFGHGATPLPPICRAAAPSCATCRHADRAECPPGCVRLSKWEAA